MSAPRGKPPYHASVLAAFRGDASVLIGRCGVPSIRHVVIASRRRSNPRASTVPAGGSLRASKPALAMTTWRDFGRVKKLYAEGARLA
jgi:hypothetical protein